MMQQLGLDATPNVLRDTFMKWQCRVRQFAMRENEGIPDDAISPHVLLAGSKDSAGQIITLMNKLPAYSVTAEFNHMNAKTQDPALRREQVLGFLSATYYQKHQEFSDTLTATFQPGSVGAQKIRDAEHCTLVFEAYAQKFEIYCKVWRLTEKNPFRQSTMAHNILFNPALPPDTIVLGFVPDWDASISEPMAN